MFKKIRENIFLISCLFLLVSIGVLTNFIIQENKYASAELFVESTKAGHNFDGFAWSENYGWVSFNSSNCDPDNNGTPDACPGAGTVSNYGVNVNYRTGAIDGEAWSSNIGWIVFDSAANSTFYDKVTGEISGTAKVIVLGADGDLVLSHGIMPAPGSDEALDNERLASLYQIISAIEAYYNDHGVYPGDSDNGGVRLSPSCPSDLKDDLVPAYLPTMPSDPLDDGTSCSSDVVDDVN